MSNKKIGTEFENEVCELLSSHGYWVHFIVPDSRGAQPFDIIAVKDGHASAIDCKTCVANTFSLSRLEENQKRSFDKWLRCGNEMPLVYVKHQGQIFVLRYDELLEKKSIKLVVAEKENGQQEE